ncbi:MAG: formate dehydrogenase accessory sulfurtransferase FdhD [Candidatus Hermodarchaeota archaeon]
MYSKFKIQRIHKKETEIQIEADIEDDIVLETPIHIFINQKIFITLIASPRDQIALAWGHLFSEGLIQSKKEIKQLVLTDNQINIQSPSLESRLKPYNQTRIITTQCGATGDYLRLLDSLKKPFVQSSFTLPINKPFDYHSLFQEHSEAHSATGGTHFTAIITPNDRVIGAEDVSRHNSVDKVIGKVLLESNQPDKVLSNSVLLTTGRIPADMLLKAARTNIPIIVSRSAPTDSAICLAESLNITLIGFLRRHRYNIYSHRERIIEKSEN